MGSSVVCACSSLKGYGMDIERYVASASALSTDPSVSGSPRQPS